LLDTQSTLKRASAEILRRGPLQRRWYCAKLRCRHFLERPRVRAYARMRNQVTSDRYKDIYEVAESEPQGSTRCPLSSTRRTPHARLLQESRDSILSHAPQNEPHHAGAEVLRAQLTAASR